MADSGVPRAGRRLPGVCHRPASGRRLAGPGFGGPSRHDAHPARSIAEHAAAGRRRRPKQAGRGPAPTGQMFRQLPSSRWVLIESATSKPRELESAEALGRVPETEPAGLGGHARHAAGRTRLHRGQSVGRTEVWIRSPIWRATIGTPMTPAGRPSPARCRLSPRRPISFTGLRSASRK